MDNTNSKSQSDDREPFAAGRRRPYHTPVLTEYGSVSKLTQTMFTGSQADGGTGFARMMTCL